MEDEFEAEDIDTNIKVIVIGNGGVGKTSLALRYCKNIFTEEYKKTVGVDFLQKKKFIKSVNKEVLFNVYDTAGQEEFNAITSRYYRGAQVAIFVFSTTDRESFNSISKWKEKVVEVCGVQIPMLLVMNKVDIPENERKVSDKEAVLLASGVEMMLFRTSVKNDTKIAEVFETAAFEFFHKKVNKVVSQNMDNVNDLNKKNKNDVIKEVENKPKGVAVDVCSNPNGFKLNNKPTEKKEKKESKCC